ncbi:MAG: hypothetical protein ACRYG2_35915, partial [Janthinobacterium lividum]
YTMRQSQFDVTQEPDGRLWLTSEPRHEGAEMSATAGFVPSIDRNEIRRSAQDTFAVIDDEGRAARTITFLDPQHDGRFRILATERAALRTER